MSASELVIKIENLPDNLKKMAEEYIDYLLHKAKKQSSVDEKWNKVLTSRAKKSEADIKRGKVFTQEQVREDFLKIVASKKSK
jgi:hypothetical protein